MTPLPASITSLPPPASIVSAPLPLVIVLALAEALIVRPEVVTLASTLSKPVTVTPSPVVWSPAVARSMAVMEAWFFSTSMSVPLPPSIVLSAPYSAMRSLPAPPNSESLPVAPSIVSLPAPPMIVFAALLPVMLTPWVARVSRLASTFWKFVTVPVSPEVWSTALPRFTDMVERASSSVLTPVPPSMEASDP